MFLPRIRRRAQATSEYLLVAAVISVAALFFLARATDPNGPIQKGGAALQQNHEKGLTNNGSKNCTEPCQKVD